MRVGTRHGRLLRRVQRNTIENERKVPHTATARRQRKATVDGGGCKQQAAAPVGSRRRGISAVCCREVDEHEEEDHQGGRCWASITVAEGGGCTWRACVEGCGLVRPSYVAATNDWDQSARLRNLRITHRMATLLPTRILRTRMSRIFHYFSRFFLSNRIVRL
jgi:hypothetical protein